MVVLGASAVAVVIAWLAVSQHRGGSRARPAPAEFQKAANTIEKGHATRVVDGQSWGLRSFGNKREEICLSQDVPGELVGAACISAKKAFARSPLYALHGARQIPNGKPKTEWDNMWVYGVAHPRVASLKLVNMDCSTELLDLDSDRVFNHVVGVAQIRKGVVPYKLIASGSNGEILGEKKVAVGLSHNAKTAGREAPRPGRECS